MIRLETMVGENVLTDRIEGWIQDWIQVELKNNIRLDGIQ